MMVLLITGCAGFIGTNFVYHYLIESPKEHVVGIDKLTYAGNLANLSGLSDSDKRRFTFIKGDICDRSLVRDLFDEYEIDRVVNFAAESHVDRSLYNPQLFLETNIIGTHVLMDVAKKEWLEGNGEYETNKFIQVSTDEVYGSLGPTGSFTEESPIRPRSPYSASKASADILAQSYFETFAFPVIITRSSNNYGPYQFPEKLIPLMITRALQHEPLPIYGDGMQVRDWIHVYDNCRAISEVLEKGDIGEIYNIGGNNERTNQDVVKQILQITSEKAGDENINENLIRYVADRPGHDRRYAIDPSKIKKEIGWQPTIDFEKGLRETVEWYINHQSWVEKVISGEYREFNRMHYGI